MDVLQLILISFGNYSLARNYSPKFEISSAQSFTTHIMNFKAMLPVLKIHELSQIYIGYKCHIFRQYHSLKLSGKY